MFRWFLGLAFAGFAAHASELPVPTILVRAITTPAGAKAGAPSLTTGADGTAYLSWIEPAKESDVPQLRVAALDAKSGQWQAGDFASGDKSVVLSGADMPQLAVDGRGTLWALWVDPRGQAWLAHSADGGNAWSPPTTWSSPAVSVEKLCTIRLADGRVLAAWLQSARGAQEGAPTQLVTRIVGIADQPDQMVDERVCDCCQLGFAPLLDTGVLLAYRGRTEDETRDIHVARWRYGHWSAPRVLSNDDWRLTACPVNGPRLGTDGSRVGAAWFTAAGTEPRVLASYSPDAGGRWLMPIQIDRGHPLGHVEVVFLRDAAFLVFWLEEDGSLWVRRVSPDFTSGEPVSIAPAGTVTARGFPRATLLADYEGGTTHARALVAYTTRDGVATVSVDVPEGDLVNRERNCACAPSAEELQGFPIRGQVVDLDERMHSAQVAHEDVPGVFDRGTHVFGVGAEEFGGLQRGRRFLGRVMWRDHAWRLFDIRLLTEPAK